MQFIDVRLSHLNKDYLLTYLLSLVRRKLSVCLSVRLSVCLANACIVTKRNKDLSRFLYHTKDILV